MAQVLNSHTGKGSGAALKPRKAPRQARSVATVDAILEATIQVLLREGMARLTTTRVAARAGVSVGTMYQYYPNKQSLLFAVLEQHLDRVVAAITAACRRQHGNHLTEISDGIVKAYLDAKISDIEVSQVVYLITSELDAADLLGSASQRAIDAMAACLATARDASFENLASVSFVLRATLAGSVRAVLELGPDKAMLDTLRAELPLMCGSYLRNRATVNGVFDLATSRT